MSLKEDVFNFLDNYRTLANCPNFFKSVSVKCLQSLEDLKNTCDKLGIKFVGYSKDMFKVDLILVDEVVEDEKFYFVKWRGHSNKYNSWEPVSQLTDSEDILAYYTFLKTPTAVLSEKMILYFIHDLMIREPYDILTMIKLYALIFRFDEEYISRVGLTFVDLRRKILKDFNDSMTKLSKLNDDLFYLMKFSEKRKVVLSRLKDWEIEINSNSSLYIKVENDIDLEGPPVNFQFINNYVSSYVNLTASPVVFCSCVHCDGNTNDCCPHNLDGSFAYDKDQLLQLPAGHPIYECNNLCKCDKNCTNRVVQHGPKVKVSIFRTKNECGWGLKTLELIQKGQFVLEYLGEIITSEQAEERGKVYLHLGRTYLFDMGFEGNCFYTIDAMLYGNASHFINHSCNPNLETFSVWINQQDPKLPRIALFAKKKIYPGEELTFDYKMMDIPNEYGVYIPEENLTPCKCNSKNCRKYLS